ncbi:MAG: type II toxin-antitoxin system VapC family toxin [Beijerinckiaceae bacterium]
MNLLLDTHIAIWAMTDRGRISPNALDMIRSPEATVFVSAVSVWEIAIKYALGNRAGAMPFSGHEAMRHFADAGFEMLDITPAHAAAAEDLPPVHADPFDRLLVAQALTEPMRLVTADKTVARYSDIVILA